MKKTVLLAWLSLFGMLSWAETQEHRLLASVAPMQAVLMAVTQGTDLSAELLIPPQRSPHDYSLSPSELQRLRETQYLLWVDPTMENRLPAFLGRMPDNAVVRQFSQLEGVHRLPMRDQGGHEGHDHGDYDTHLWLDPSNLGLLALAVAEDLSALYPEHAATFASNAQGYQQQMQALDQELRTLTQPLQGKPFVVFHDAYQYFEQRYGLTSLAAVMSPGRTGTSLQRQFQLRALIRDQDVVCVFTEPQFEPGRVQALVGDNARLAQLDPLGATLAAGLGFNQRLLLNLAESLHQCLMEMEK